MFRVNNKNTVFYCYFWIYFTTFSIASTVDLEQDNVSLDFDLILQRLGHFSWSLVISVISSEVFDGTKVLSS